MIKQLLARVVHLIHLCIYSWRAVGPRSIARNLLAWTSDADARRVDSGFDAKYGTDTDAALTPAEAAIPADGGRPTKHFRVGWTVWTNEAWLDKRTAMPAIAHELAAVPA